MAEHVQLSGPNARLYESILDWLEHTPKNVERLRLDINSVPDRVLVDFTAEDAHEKGLDNLARYIVTQALDVAEVEARECRFTLQWLRAEVPILTKVFRAGAYWQGHGPGSNFDGTAQDQLGQLQRHLEATQRTMLGTVKSLLDAQTQVIMQQRLELQEARAHHESLRGKEEALRLEELRQLIAELEQEGGNKDLDRLFQVGIQIGQQMGLLPAPPNDGPPQH